MVLNIHNLKPIQLFSYICNFQTCCKIQLEDFSDPLESLNGSIKNSPLKIELKKSSGLSTSSSIVNRLNKIFSDDKIRLELDKPSSGVILLINILILKYIHTEYSEIDLILMDEPDRHFEP